MSDDHQNNNKKTRRSQTTANKRVIGCFKQDEGTITSIKAEDRAQPDTVPSSVSRSSMGAPAPTTRSSKPVQRPLAFVEKDFVVKQDQEEKAEEEEGEREARIAPIPETVTSTFAGDPGRQHPTNHGDYDNNYNTNNRSRVAIKNEDSVPDANTTNERKEGSAMTLIKSEEIDNNDDACSTKKSRRSRRKRKEHPCSTLIPTNDSVLTKKKRNINQQGREPAVVVSNSNARRTSPRRNKKHQHQNNTIIKSSDNNDNDNNETNCCRFCNDPDWETKIYYKCRTVLLKYFPKSHNNPNPGWYKGTIRMHHLSSSNSGSGSGSDSDYYEYEEGASNSSSEEESEEQCIIFNEIHYEDGDMENITQKDLKLQLMDGGGVKILHPTKMATESDSDYEEEADNSSEEEREEEVKILHPTKKPRTSNAACSNLVDDMPPASSSDNRFDQNWLEKFQRLKQFQAENGHCRVPKNYGPDPSLANWVNHQRNFCKQGKLAEERVKELNKIGFEWVLAEKIIPTWDEMYCRLKEFKEENGHCLVPFRYGLDPSLGKWVNKQRQHYKKGTLAPDRAEKLEEIGFKCDARAETWDEMFGRLEQYKAENGHCRVPNKYGPDPSLGRWVRKQRENYKNGNLVQFRVEKLDKIGFEWDPGAKTKDLSSWQEKYNRLKRFKAENGNCRVPKRYGPDPSLGFWVMNQRKFCKEGKLTEDRKKKLNKIGFEWAPFQTT